MPVHVMILAAVFVIGDGPEKKSGEIQQQRLDMRGKWEGTFQFMGSVFGQQGVRVLEWKVVIEKGEERFYDKGQCIGGQGWKVVDEGDGKIRLNGNPNKGCWGIYKVEGDKVTICFSDIPNPRPKEFRVTKEQAVFILRRVKEKK